MGKTVFHIYRHSLRPKDVPGMPREDRISEEGEAFAFEEGKKSLATRIPKGAYVEGRVGKAARLKASLLKIFEGAGIKPERISMDSRLSLPTSGESEREEKYYLAKGAKFLPLAFSGRKSVPSYIPRFRPHAVPLLEMMKEEIAKSRRKGETHYVCVTHQGRPEALVLALTGRKWKYVGKPTAPLEKVTVELHADGKGVVRFRGRSQSFNLQGRRLRRLTKPAGRE